MSPPRKRKRLPSSAIERIRTGQMSVSDLVVVARLLGRDDLAEAAEAIERAHAWCDQVEAAMRWARPRSTPGRR